VEAVETAIWLAEVAPKLGKSGKRAGTLTQAGVTFYTSRNF